jgi:carboxyl-terminal processing protease
MRCLFGLLLLSPLLVAAEPRAEPAAPAGEAASAAGKSDPYPAIERFIRVLEAVQANHPDESLVDSDRLVNRALEGMLGSLDRHSSFIHPETYAVVEDAHIDPHLPALGFTLGQREDGLYLTAVDDASPASAAGLRPGDRLLAADAKDLAGIPLDDALAMLAGNPGEVLALRAQRPQEPEAREAKLVRVARHALAVTDADLLENSTVGYFALNEFTAAAPHEVEQALDKLEDSGMTALVMDLRGNPGGLLTASVEILGFFLAPETEVVFTRGRSPENSSPALKTPARQRRQRDYPLHVLVDSHSASASELVSAALQDLKRARVYGEKTYGKGSVQNIIPMGGGTALRLTIATYHTPSGRTPHLVGVTPDVLVPVTEADRANLEISRRREAATPLERQKLAAWTDPVLASAAAAAKTP